MTSGCRPIPPRHASARIPTHGRPQIELVSLIRHAIDCRFSRPTKQSFYRKEKLWGQLAMTLFSNLSLFCFSYVSQQFSLRACASSITRGLYFSVLPRDAPRRADASWSRSCLSRFIYSCACSKPSFHEGGNGGQGPDAPVGSLLEAAANRIILISPWCAGAEIRPSIYRYGWKFAGRS